MRKISLLFVIYAFFFVSVFAQTGELPEILKRMINHQKALKSLQANIKITKFSVQSSENFTKEGIVKFMPQINDYLLRIDSTKPALESFLIVKNKYLLYQPNPNPLYLPNVNTAFTGMITDSQKNMFMIFSILSKEKLKADYNIKYFGVEKVNETISTWHLDFTPKIATGYKKIDLWVDNNGMPIQSKIIENNGDWANIKFTNIQKNIKIEVADFKVELSKETKLIKN